MRGKENLSSFKQCDDDRRMASNWNKFCLLMWKNWLLSWRHKLQTIMEILIPVLSSAVIVYLRIKANRELINETRYSPIEISKPLLSMLDSSSILQIKEFKFVFTPNNDHIRKLLLDAANSLLVKDIVAADNSTHLEAIMENQRLIAGIEFHHPPNMEMLPANLKYSLRFPSELRTNFAGVSEPLNYNWKTFSLYPILISGGQRGINLNEGGPVWYLREGFLSIQNEIARSYARIKCGEINCKNYNLPDIQMQRYPYPSYFADDLLEKLNKLVSLFIFLSFIYPTINTVRFITIEKERQLKEAMKIAGLQNWLHWISWFIRTMIFMTVTISLMVALFQTEIPGVKAPVFTYSDWSTIWLFLFVYSIAMTTFCFMMSVFFTKANTAAAVAGLIWFLSYSPFLSTISFYNLISPTMKLLLCIPINAAMGFGFQLILRLEGTGDGLQWSNFWQPITVDENLTVGITMCFMLLSSCIHVIISLYVEKILPGCYGISEKWYFPFTKNFWFGASEYTGDDDSLNDDGTCLTDLNFENEPENRHAGVKLKNLKKVYSNGKVACRGTTLNMFNDQITVLLGHNGAGKTTTMSILTGMIPPTSGTATISGYDIRTSLHKARGSIGFCPQHNILFGELTVREHIIFYGSLKGLRKDEIEQEVSHYVKLLELESKINTKSECLSGGMQRKLSVCIALCGRSKVVFCDEPSSGMDPAARRALWDLLQNEKKGRTILLTTHFMDEADVIGDRIAIMADGELKCCGTPFFLKKRFGTGYRLICVTNENCWPKVVTNLLQNYIPNIEVMSDVGKELTYDLGSEQIKKFEPMFEKLEIAQKSLKIERFGVSMSTLDEVFMKVGTDPGKSDEFPKAYNGYSMQLLHGCALRANQWYAMFKKRFIYWKRSRIFSLQISIAMILVVTLLSLPDVVKRLTLPPMELSLSAYGETTVLLETPKLMGADSEVDRILDEYRNIFAEYKPKAHLEEITEDIQLHFLKLAQTKSMLSRVNTQYLAGLSFDSQKSQFLAFFNNQLFHTAPLSLNLIHNAMLKAKFGSLYSIEITNSPIPFSVEARMALIVTGSNIGEVLAINITFAMAVVGAFYVVFYIKERETKSKLLQFVSGVKVHIFWLASLLFDLGTFVLIALFTVITIFIFQEDGWSTLSELSAVFLLLLVFGFAVIPIAMFSTIFFSIPSTGFIRMLIIFIFTGLTSYFVLKSMTSLNLEGVAEDMKWYLLAFPHYSLISGLNNLNRISSMALLCQKWCDRLEPCGRDLLCEFKEKCCLGSYFDWNEPGIGRNLTYMFATGIAFLVLLLVVEYRVFSCYTLNIRRSKIFNETNVVDDDVEDEKRRVNAMTIEDLQEHNLVLQNLSKFYGNTLAVNDISTAIQGTECFGLLGINGAGKTATFKMLTGDTNISSGNAFLRGINLKADMQKVQRTIGYCPQNDALFDEFTGRETLRMYALLRGVPYADIDELIIRLANDLDFMKHIDKKVMKYSGGNKRKLSTAVALIGNPVVIYFDEPTTGMDPGAKRHLWKMISKVRDSGKSIVLTSHSMEECEAVCTRLAIMVNGEFKCLGSTQHLKSKFSKGYLLTFKVRKSEFGLVSTLEDPQTYQIKEFIKRHFPGADLKEEHQGLLTYYVPPTKEMKWSKMFGLMEIGKRTLPIEDYSISQTSLEQVFLSFTKFQREQTHQHRSADRLR